MSGKDAGAANEHGLNAVSSASAKIAAAKAA